MAPIIGVDAMGICFSAGDSWDVPMLDIVNPCDNVSSVLDGTFGELLDGIFRISGSCNCTVSVLDMIWLVDALGSLDSLLDFIASVALSDAVSEL